MTDKELMDKIEDLTIRICIVCSAYDKFNRVMSECMLKSVQDIKEIRKHFEMDQEEGED